MTRVARRSEQPPCHPSQMALADQKWSGSAGQLLISDVSCSHFARSSAAVLGQCWHDLTTLSKPWRSEVQN